MSGGTGTDQRGDGSGTPRSSIEPEADADVRDDNAERTAMPEAPPELPPTVSSEVPRGRGEDDAGRRPTLRLSVNASQFYMQGFNGVLDVKVENLSPSAFDSVRVQVSGPLLGGLKHEPWTCVLGAREGLEKKFEAEPKKAGVTIVEFQIQAWQGGSCCSYWAETELPVFEKASQLNDIKIQADRFISVGGGAAGSKDMAHAVTVNIENLVKQEKIRDANDLMRAYQTLPAAFKEVRLKPQSAPPPGPGLDVPAPENPAAEIRSSRRRVFAVAGIVVAAVLVAVVISRFVPGTPSAGEHGVPSTPARVRSADVNRPVVPGPPRRESAKESRTEVSSQQVTYARTEEYLNEIARVRVAEEKYGSALAGYDIDVLNRYGGQAWLDVCNSITFARAAASDVNEAVRWYERAVELLPAAWRMAERRGEDKPPEGEKVYRLEQAGEAMLREISRVTAADSGPWRLRQMVGPDRVRTKFDVVFENRLLLLCQGRQDIRLAGFEEGMVPGRRLSITIGRARQGQVLVLSGVVTRAENGVSLGVVRVQVDEAVESLLATQAIAREQSAVQPDGNRQVVEVPALQLTYAITGMQAERGSWKPVAVTNGVALSSGDCFKINFSSNEDCYMYVLLYGSGGISQCLFPHQKIRLENRIRGGSVHTLPDGDNWYHLDRATGTETVYLVASYGPMQDIAGLLQRMDGAGPQEQQKVSADLRQALRGVSARGLETDRYVASFARGVSAVAPPPWSVSHEGNPVEAVTAVVRGEVSVVEVVSFEHR